MAAPCSRWRGVVVAVVVGAEVAGAGVAAAAVAAAAAAAALAAAAAAASASVSVARRRAFTSCLLHIDWPDSTIDPANLVAAANCEIPLPSAHRLFEA
jgi:hypothetical protein